MTAIKRQLGSNQTGLGQYNERLILSLVRQQPGIAKAELARMTQLTPQTISVIVNRLIDDGFILTGAKQRGRVGKPSTGLLLNPDGVFSIGVKIGRRSLDIILMAFDGAIVRRKTSYHDFPEPAKTLPEILAVIEEMRQSLEPSLRQRIIGIGLAAPGSLAGWSHEFEASESLVKAWQSVDLADAISAQTDLPVSMMNDVSAACLAELSLNKERRSHDFLYLYVGTFIGGGIVMNGKLLTGNRGNAGSIGSMTTALVSQGEAPSQVLATASLRTLERKLQAHNLMIESLHGYQELDGQIRTLFDEWAEEAAPILAGAIVNAQSVLDTEKVVIDGTLPRAQLQSLIAKITKALSFYNLTGLDMPELDAGMIGYEARALGGAFLPVYAQYAPDRDVFLKMMSKHPTFGQSVLGSDMKA